MKYINKIIPEIIEALKENGGLLNEKDLYDIISKRLEQENDGRFSQRELNKILLILETRGLIRVSFLKKNVRTVQLLSEREEKIDMEVAPDGSRP